MKSYLAQFAARAIISELVSISELAQPLESGTHFPLFLLCLQQLAKLQDREWLTELFQQSKVNMQKMLPGKSLFRYFILVHEMVQNTQKPVNIVTSVRSVVPSSLRIMTSNRYQ